MPLKPQGRIFNDITETMGGTPLVRINRLVPKDHATVLAKCEFFNPLSSVKDRIGVAMIDAAEREGKVDRDTVIVEPTSGNTGIALAFVCAAKGYKLILTMPESMSIERRRLLKALGAQVVLTPAADGMRGSIQRAGDPARAQEKLHAPAVSESGEPGDSPHDDGRRDLAGHQRPGRYPRRRRGHRRVDHRHFGSDQA